MLLDRYPHYIFNFAAPIVMHDEGILAGDYARVKQYVAAGRWFPPARRWKKAT